MSATCLHCTGPLGAEHRAVKLWCAGQSQKGRCCKPCWSKQLLGSLLYSADVCHKKKCVCGWCAEWQAMQAAKETAT